MNARIRACIGVPWRLATKMNGVAIGDLVELPNGAIGTITHITLYICDTNDPRWFRDCRGPANCTLERVSLGDMISLAHSKGQMHAVTKIQCFVDDGNQAFSPEHLKQPDPVRIRLWRREVYDAKRVELVKQLRQAERALKQLDFDYEQEVNTDWKQVN